MPPTLRVRHKSDSIDSITVDVKPPASIKVLPKRTAKTLFFDLPPELRNQIYEYAATHETTLSFKSTKLLYVSTLGLVCRQMREEYGGIYNSEVPKYADRVFVHITNFKERDVDWNIETLRSGFNRKPTMLNIVIHLTNTFEKYLCNLRSLANRYAWSAGLTEAEESFGGVNYKVILSPGFDLVYLRESLRKMDWCLRRGPHTNGWQALKSAIEKAMDEYPAWCDARSKRRRSADHDGTTKRRRIS